MAMEGRESGTVKAWIEERGMGFVTPANGGLDHFVHRSMLTDGQSLQIGGQVSFVPSVDAQKGKPTATQLIGACPAPGAIDGFGAPAQPTQEGYQVGVVKAWIDGRGMGFITPPDGSADLFVHQSFLTDGVSLIIGSQVQYMAGWDAVKNKAIAQNVSGASQVKGAGGPPGKGGGPPPPAGDNLYISGLPADSTDTSIAQTFGQYGVVTSVKLLPDNGSPNRVALVRMGAAEQADWLVWNLNGNIPLGLETIVQVKHSASGGGKGGGAQVAPPGGGQPWAAPQQQWQAPKPVTPSSGDNLYIAGLPMESTTESVTALFQQYGTVVSCKCLESPGKPDKVGLVRFGSFDEAKWVLENLNGNIPAGLEAHGSILSIKYASNHQGGKDAKGGKGAGYGPAPQDPWSQGQAGDAWSSPYGKGGGAQPQPWAPAPQTAAPAVPQRIPPPAHMKKDKLQVGGLPADSTEESVTALIGQYGPITICKMVGPGTANLTMGTEESAKWILETLNGNIPQGIDNPVNISYAAPSNPQIAPAPPQWAGGGAQQAPWGAAAPQAQQAPPMSGEMTTGTVKHWVEEKGMGFITPSDGGQDCFIHRSNLMDGLSLIAGAPVSFVKGWDNLKAKPTAVQVSGAVGGEGVGKGATKGCGDGGAGKGW